MSEWISVKDRLPEREERVVAYPTELCGVVGLCLLDEYGEWQSELGQVLYPGWTKRITHWMPLPAPPRRQWTKDDALRAAIEHLERLSTRSAFLDQPPADDLYGPLNIRHERQHLLPKLREALEAK